MFEHSIEDITAVTFDMPSFTEIVGALDKDKSTTDSLPSIVVMNRFTRQIVAEYTGRTGEAKDFYEVCRKLLLYYNAIGMYEKNLIGLYNYFDQMKCTYLLADTPYQLRSTDTYKAGTNTAKGIIGTLTPNGFAWSETLGIQALGFVSGLDKDGIEKYSTDIISDNFTFIGSKSDAGDSSQYNNQSQGSDDFNQSSAAQHDDDVPF